MNHDVDNSCKSPGSDPVAIFGSGGRLGATLAAAWRDRLPMLPFPRATLDVADSSAVDAAIEECAAAGVRAIVNATGMTSLEACEDHPALAHRVNAAAVAQMARACAEKGIRFFHFSTDYVFDGKKQTPYQEEDAACPLSVYGETKLAGERATLEADGGHMVFRVAWVFGPGRPAFPDMVIQRAVEGGEVAVVADKWASPTSAEDVADWLFPLVKQARDASLPGGLFHLCNSGICSWMQYAEHALEAAQSAGLTVSTTRPAALALAEMKMFRAPRPVHSGMSNAKFEKMFGVHLRSWQDALSEYVRRKYSKRD
jgi:dTDP-4-dehydrorhamnose reductase